MAEIDLGFEQLTDQTHRMATDMANTEKAASGLVGLFGKGAELYLGWSAFQTVMTGVVKRSEMFKNISGALSVDNLNRTKLLSRELGLLSEKHAVEQNIRNSAGAVSELDNRRLADLDSELGMLQKQKVVADEQLRYGNTSIALLTAYKGAALDLYVKTQQFNQNLIEANSNYEYRNKLLTDTLTIQAQMGVSFDKITHAAQALVHYGMDTEDSWETNLRLVVQMETGLGVSVGHSARLASLVERQLKGSFKDISAIMSEIVNKTALAGDEAAQLAQTIGTAMSRLQPGLGAAGLPEVLKLVGRYEGALKEVGGQAGGIQQLLSNLTTTQGMTGATALGAQPEFIATAEGVKGVLDTFAAYGDFLVGTSQGWQRQMSLDLMASLFNVSADQANQMMIAIKRANAQQSDQISLQDRWREQMRATNSGLSRLTNSLLALVEGAMNPLVRLIGSAASAMADFTEGLLKSQTAVTTVGYVLLTGFVFLTARMWGLARALAAVVLSSSLATGALNRASAVQASTVAAQYFGKFIPMSLGEVFRQSLMTFRAGSIGSGAFPTVVSGWALIKPALTGMFGSLLGPLSFIGRLLLGLFSLPGLIVGVAAGLAYWGYKLYSETKRLNEETAKTQKLIEQSESTLEINRWRNVAQSIQSGPDTEDALRNYRFLAEDIRAKAKTPEGLQADLTAAYNTMVEKVDAMVTQATMFKPLSERTLAETAHQDNLLDMSADLLKVNEDQFKIAKADFAEKEKIRQDEEQHRAIQRALQTEARPHAFKY